MLIYIQGRAENRHLGDFGPEIEPLLALGILGDLPERVRRRMLEPLERRDPFGRSLIFGHLSLVLFIIAALQF